MSDVGTSNKNGKNEGETTVCYIVVEPGKVREVQIGKESGVEKAAEYGGIRGITLEADPTKCICNPDGKSYNRVTKNGKSSIIEVDNNKVERYLKKFNKKTEKPGKIEVGYNKVERNPKKFNKETEKPGKIER